jgi:hypothetical protein
MSLFVPLNMVFLVVCIDVKEERGEICPIN